MISHFYICDVMVSLLSGMEESRFSSRSGQIKHYKIGTCCFFSVKHVALKLVLVVSSPLSTWH